MSLRYQIHLRILITLLIVLTLGGTMLVFQARQSVEKEVQSSVQLAIQLIKLNLAKKTETAWLREMTSLKEIEDLNIQIHYPFGATLTTPPRHAEPIQTPRWFYWMVKNSSPPFYVSLKMADEQPISIKIEANASDEIAEAWQETKVFFGVILLLSGGLFWAVNVIFRQVLQTVESILKNLTEIESENYRNPLPLFAITEFARIALAINHLTATLRKACQENNRLTLHSLEIAEEQRQTLAQELHDELGQSITAIKVMAVTGKKTAGNHQAEIYQSIISVCDHLVTVVRSMMKNLHPLVLTELGLSASLHDLISHWQTRTPELKISLSCDADIDEIEIKKAIQVFRMVQEAITNAVRHAQAKSLIISLSMHGVNHKTLSIEIEDNGVGCDLQNLSLGFGLLGMQARVKSLNGNMEIVTAKNQGMKIKISIPCHNTVEDSLMRIR